MLDNAVLNRAKDTKLEKKFGMKFLKQMNKKNVELKNIIFDKIKKQVAHQVWKKVWSQILDPVYSQVGSQIKTQIYDEILEIYK